MGRARGVRWIAVLVGVAAILAGWLLGSPPNSTPDEAAHLVRGMAAAEGQWHGTDAAAFYGDRNLSADAGRSFSLPARLTIGDLAPCYHGRPTKTPADCSGTFVLEKGRAYSHVGAYFPLAYVPLGIAEISARHPLGADYAGRAVQAIWCLALLGLAFGCVSNRRERIAWFAGFLPITAFAATAPATNGIEVCGALTLAAGALAAHRQPSRTAAWAFVAGATSLAIAKEGGPFFLGAEAVLLAVAARDLRWIPRIGPWRIGAWLAPVVGAGANLAWTVLYGTNPVTYPRPSLTSGALHREVWQQLQHYPWQLFTQFGWADTYVPQWVVIAGYVCCSVVLAVLALRAGRWGVLVALLGLVVAGVAAAAFAVIEIRGGYGLQGRYVLAALVPLPLLACLAGQRSEPQRRRALLGAEVLLALAAGGLVVMQGVSALTLVRRYVVGADGPWQLSPAQWTPPGGVALTLALIAAGCVLLGAAVLVGRDGHAATPVDREVPG